MRKNVKNDKVLRAISIGLATMIAVTSTPVSVLAEEGGAADPAASSSTNPATSSPEQQIGSIVDNLSEKAGKAEEYTGNVKEGEGENAKPASGTIGTKAQEAQDDISKADAALALESENGDLYKTADNCGQAVDRLLNDKGKESSDGTKKIYSSEQLEKKLEADDKFGVNITDDGKGNITGVDTLVLEGKVSEANGKINSADQAKKDAKEKIDTVKATVGDENTEGTVKQSIKAAEDAKDTADKDTKAALGVDADSTEVDTFKDAQEKIQEIQTSIDNETQKKLDAIQTSLENASTDPEKKSVKDAIDGATVAVTEATNASTNAVTVVGENLEKVKDALKDATAYADEAEQHSADYNREQMVNIAGKAQNAANNAKTAAELADKAVEAAQEAENKAGQAVQDAWNELNDVEGEAIQVLQEYQKQLDAYNYLNDTSIVDANDSRTKARNAMAAANTAIQNALNLFYDKETTVEGATKKINTEIDAMNNAINLANEAIKVITDLIPDFNYKNDPGAATNKLHPWSAAQKKYTDVNTRVTNQATALNNAYTEYTEAKKKTGEVKANQQAAHNMLDEIDKLVTEATDEIIDKYETWLGETDVDLQNLRALFTSGKSYSELLAEQSQANSDLGTAGTNLVNANKDLPGTDDEKNLDADGVVTRYNDAVSAKKGDGTEENPGLDAKASTAAATVSTKKEELNGYFTEESNTKDRVQYELPGLIDNATGILQAKGNEKYLLDEKGYPSKDEKGEYIYADSYKQLLADIEAADPSKTVGLNDNNEELEEKDAIYKEKKNVNGKEVEYWYKKDGNTTVTGGKPDRVEDQYAIEQKDPERKIEDGELVETCFYHYSQDITDSEKRISYKRQDQEMTSLVRHYKQGDEWAEKPNSNEAKYELLRMWLGGNNLLNADLTLDDLDIDPNPYGPTGTVTATIKTKENGKEEHKFSYYLTVRSINDGDWGWVATYAIELTELSAKLSGDYTVVSKTPVKEFTKTTKADVAKKKKDAIDKATDAAKNQLEGYLKERDDYNTVVNNKARVSNELYGEGGSESAPKEGSLQDVLNKANKAKDDNDKIINGLKDYIEPYTSASTKKGEADKRVAAAGKLGKNEFDLDKVKGLSDEKKKAYTEKYTDALGYRQRIVDAQTEANRLKGEVKDALDILDAKVTDENEAITKYNETNAKITTARSRLATVKAKLDILKRAQEEAQGFTKKIEKDGTITLTPIKKEERKYVQNSLSGVVVDKNKKLIVDRKITIDGKEYDLDELQAEIEGILSGLKEFEESEISNYNDLDLLKFNEEFGSVSSNDIEDEKESGKLIVKLSEKLTKALNFASGILETAENNLEKARGERKKAEDNAKELQTLATNAQKEADRAAEALKNWKAPAPKKDPSDPGKDNGNGNGQSNVSPSANNGTAGNNGTAANAGTTTNTASSSDDDDDDSSSESSSSSSSEGAGSGTVVGTLASTGTLPGGDSIVLTPVADFTGAAPAGVAGARTGRGPARGVAGVRVDNDAAGDGEGDGADANAAGNNIVVLDATGKDTAIDNAKDADDKNDQAGNKTPIKIENNKVPLAEAPTEKGVDMKLWGLLAAAAAAIAGFGGYEHNKRKKAAAQADEMKKYKK